MGPNGGIRRQRRCSGRFPQLVGSATDGLIETEASPPERPPTPPGTSPASEHSPKPPPAPGSIRRTLHRPAVFHRPPGEGQPECTASAYSYPNGNPAPCAIRPRLRHFPHLRIQKRGSTRRSLPAPGRAEPSAEELNLYSTRLITAVGQLVTQSSQPSQFSG